jgi:hypothetical protein
MVGVRRRPLREFVILLVGLSTPVGILAVNLSAFVMMHLAEFRLGIAICALISGLCLNGLGAYVALNRAQASAPMLFAEYRWWAISLVSLVVVGWSVLGAWGTYWSMQDPRHLPNLAAVLTALWLLLLPFAAAFASRRFKLLDRPPARETARKKEGSPTMGEPP